MFKKLQYLKYYKLFIILRPKISILWSQKRGGRGAPSAEVYENKVWVRVQWSDTS